MALDIARELAAMRRMTVSQLRARYVEVFGESTRSSNRQHLIRRIAWRLQALEEGSLSDRAVRRAAELADDANLRLTAPRPRNARNIPQSIPLKIARSLTGTPPVRGFYPRASPEPRTSDAFRDRRLPPPGNVIAHVYKGRHLRVTVLEDGFEYEGLQYRSLKLSMPLVVFRKMGIPIYVVFDADAHDQSDQHKTQNRLLLRLLGGVEADYPTEATYPLYAVVGDEMARHLKTSLGATDYDRIANSVAAELSYSGSSRAMKNVDAAALFASRVYHEGKRLPLLEEIVEHVTALTPELVIA